MLAAVDLGGTNTDVLLAAADGAIMRSAVLPWAPVGEAADLGRILLRAGATVADVAAVAVTGGRHRALPNALQMEGRDGAIPILHVDELVAIGRGGLLGSGVPRALIMSMGTGTAMIAAGPEGFHHLGGTAVGGGTVLGLARLLLGTNSHQRIGDLAAMGDPRAVDLSVGDIVGGPVGIVPAEMTAAHFGKIGLPSYDAATARPEDVAAGLMELVGQVLGRLGLMTARAVDLDAVVLTGHLVEWPGIRRAMQRVAGAFGGRIIVPPEPGLATARGALAVLHEQR